MKLFHVSDVLSVTTGRLVSYRHMDGIYAILNFLTGDNLYTHQLPRAMDACRPWLASQFPKLMNDSPEMQPFLAKMDEVAKSDLNREQRAVVIASWVDTVKKKLGLPDMIPVYELGADMHTHIDPLEELEALVGKDRVIAVAIDPEGK